MDSHQGAAGFAFDMNMDFSTVFPKPNEGETSNGFFFGDEGIDTTTTFVDPLAMFPQQTPTCYDIQQGLPLDSTSGSASVWDGQLTPDLQHGLCSDNASGSSSAWHSSSFDSLYQPQTSFSLGKRPLQLDVEDLPQTKRHESISDFTLFPTPAATWAQDMQSTPAASSIEFGISDEAADMCAMWFNKYAILPSDRHIDSLSQLTGEPADAIRHWFGRLMKQGMNTSQGDSAYRSQTSLPQSNQFWDEHATSLVQVPQLPFDESNQGSITTNSDVSPMQETAKISQSSNTLRGGRKSRCAPTDDLSLLSRDPSKIYQCTRKCGKRYGRKCDWKRNEEEGYPCKSWVCNLCKSTGTENVKPCYRKYHFAQHFRNIHPGINCEDYQEASVVCSETEFPRRCGFCRHRFESRQDRIDHIADHFKKGKCMLDWDDGETNDGSNDNTNDDDDDRPSDDDSDSSKPHQPPPRVPRGGSDSQYYGSGGHNDGGNGSGSQGSYFQFQLSRLSESEAGSQVYYAQQPIIKPTSDQRMRCRSEPPQQRSSSIHELDATAEHDAGPLARDAVSRSLTFAKQDRPVSLFDGPKSTNDAITTGAGTLVVRQEYQSSDSMPVEPKVLQLIPINSQSFLSVRFLGSGGFSTVDEVVHRGTKLRLGRKTLKNRDPAAVEELRKEVNVLQKLRHPHVIRFLGAYSQGDKLSILLSPIADTTLSLWLERFTHAKPGNFSQIITKMFGCLASSVRYLHEQRPVVKHLDIKPQNILIVEGDGEFPHVVLCDFGISTSDDICEGRPQPLTRQYVAPEVFGGFHRTSRTSAADIWSLGCVFAEMASIPFGESNPKWTSLRSEFSGRTGKYYWQDVSGLQNRLALVLENATSAPERTIACTLQAMLQRQPAERPNASSLTLVFTPAPCCLSWPNDKAAYPGPQEELSMVEMLIHEDDKDCRDQVNQCSGIATTARQDKPGAQAWLEQCLHGHGACSHSGLSGSKTLPTRLVDIRPEEGTSCVRIVDSASIKSLAESVDYVALSHLWNESHTSLTTADLEAMQLGIPLSTLSGALNTAITAAQDLGYRYIWTDSLCVIQDAEESRREECANMASVFRNAALTIVLDAIENGVEEFRKALAESDSGFAWDTRAWALQERLLSHRFLHLGQEQMYWECNSLKASQTFPQGLPLLVWEKAHSKPETLKGIQPGMKEMPSYNSLLAPDAIAASTENRLRPDAATVTDKNSSSLRTEPLRDLQWIRKEGDGIGDGTEAAQTILQTDNAVASSATSGKSPITSDKLGNFPVFTTCTCTDGDKRLTVDGGTHNCNSKALLASNDVDGRRDIKSSGQLDRHGSRNGRLRDGDPNAKGSGKGLVCGDANAAS
ncbi:hypothetical protein HBH56_131480 [Parastagonospora nodorum]|uniref:Protein kinase domain-containing protein n=1 Tax=Phaeosphaeria nodorum (strain SN15 / ATCC MYA-4574 / FGSC 10173) TaxID=321614 RepID=A0A7U2FCT4_PHANO|nr:hypothetical protein HBH56_131480 [Parastagonospora nodorum]QRD02892.1 hypothetical protein JI435_116180 [Parastagonospora nodorum SN15]KAH3938101.1 hypothetical protein HBH54_007210 [Parastagonospora nodorum]KAH4120202.1 hypothetical protein HBH47_115600 [Parastagonospora nodorum]KAH4144167.1 hypothetical protein HBH45_027510 [Parastagonospora nodorum]